MTREEIKKLVSELTIEEKAGLTSGRDTWFTKAVERLGIPNTRLSDGPHGLRTQDGDNASLAESASAKAVCYPTASATACSFDRELLEGMGKELGREAQAYGVNVLLGPGINMKRSPLCGRNFEYFSEDPVLAGELGAAFVKGVQSEGCGTSLKHFFANNQETRRMDSSSDIDERTMRELYLPAFETVVKKSQPWTVMASYNKINGTHATENRWALTEVLRGEWGFEGLVMSDWGATHDRVGAIEAGCDLTMPAEDTDGDLVKAVQEGRLSMEALDACCVRILELAFRAKESQKKGMTFDFEAGHSLARRVAAESAVLMKNNGILPLGRASRAAFIGLYAKAPRYQGGGSSHINSGKVISAYEAAKDAGFSVTFSDGYREDGTTCEELLKQAADSAKAADVAVVFIGMTDAMESEGVDRMHMRLPDGHNALVEAVCAANPDTVVVLHGGSPVELPWISDPKALLNVYLGGEAVGEATVDILYGEVNPGGHLAESWPVRLEDNPSYLTYFGNGGMVPYQEGLFIGYRYYESKKMPVAFPFGYGLSYTSFEYSDLILDRAEIDEGGEVKVSVNVKNVGSHTGKAVVQLYVAPEKVEMIRPVRELKDFTKIELAPDESRTVEFTLSKRAFSYWHPQRHTWHTESGFFDVQIGENAHDIQLSAKLKINAEPIPPLGGYSTAMPMSDFAKSIKGHRFLDENIVYMIKGMAQMGYIPQEAVSMLDNIPGGINLAVIDQIAAKAGQSAAGGSGLKALLGQSLGILQSFLPQDKKEELAGLIDELNA